ncbi:Coiled-coil domain-containing protein 33 [Bagarius yarrelli]|uniref:Coiled-coil domain-containing protein 33 n=1 Tax=Bagarius yarrelli TaxID=175774 RepID=A0A556U444_BAGYA|nr:Coiled-coil domain-containing protein 33 [Bagarius yarrelli]
MIEASLQAYISHSTAISLPPGVMALICFYPSCVCVYLKLQKDAYDLPAYDALAQVLSEYQHTFKIPKAPQQSKGEPKQQKMSKRSSELNQTFEIHSPNERLPVINDQNDGPQVAEITEHQTKELENYCSAMCKMAEDIIALRSQVTSLEKQNSQLRSKLSMNQDLSRTVLDDTDVDVMTKAEIADRLDVSFFLLVNEVIEKMERVLTTKLRERNKEIAERKKKVLKGKESVPPRGDDEDSEESKMREIKSILASENSRLREELERLRQQPQPIIIQQPAQQPFPDCEKLRLLEQLEKAEACTRTLGKQLEENARQWGKEKQDLLTRLDEYKHGFARTSTLHHLPLVITHP